MDGPSARPPPQPVTSMGLLVGLAGSSPCRDQNDGNVLVGVALVPPMPDDDAFLREQAKRCRRMAELWHEIELTQSMLALALEYEARADELDRGRGENES